MSMATSCRYWGYKMNTLLVQFANELGIKILACNDNSIAFARNVSDSELQAYHSKANLYNIGFDTKLPARRLL